MKRMHFAAIVFVFVAVVCVDLGRSVSMAQEMKARGYIPITVKNYPTPSSTPTPSRTATPPPSVTPLPRPSVVVVNSTTFEPYADSKSLYLVGEVSNNTSSNVRFVKINAILRDSSGKIIDGEETYSDIGILTPSMRSGFRIIFSNITTWSTYELTTVWDETDEVPFELSIVSQESYFDSSNAFHVRGEVKNQDSREHKFVGLFLTMYDKDNGVIAADQSFASPDTLAPGQQSTFDIEMYFWKHKPDKGKVHHHILRAIDD